MKYETIDEDQIKAIFNGEPVPPPKDWSSSDMPLANTSGDSGASGTSGSVTG